MVAEKVIVILLIATILLSLFSIVITLGINTDLFKLVKQARTKSSSNSANVQLIVEKTGGINEAG